MTPTAEPPARPRCGGALLAAATVAALQALYAALANPAPALDYHLLVAALLVGGSAAFGWLARTCRIQAPWILAAWLIALAALTISKRTAVALAVPLALALLIAHRRSIGFAVQAIVVGSAFALGEIGAVAFANAPPWRLAPAAFREAAVHAGCFALALAVLLTVATLLRRRPPFALLIPATVATVIAVGAAAPAALERAAMPAIEALAPRIDAPNIVLLVVDTVRADHLSLYGAARDTTPQLRRFLESRPNAAIYPRAYSCGNWTVPSHASLFTGELPTEHGADMPIVPLPTLAHHGTPLLAEQLAALGYRTSAVFANPWLDVIPGLGRGFELYRKLGTPHILPPTGERLRSLLLPGCASRVENPEVSGSEVAAAIDAALPDGGGAFVFANFMDAHSPYAPEPGYLGRFGPHGLRDRYPAHFSYADGAPFIARQRDRYDEKLLYLDSVIAGLLERLQQRGLLDRSWVVIAGDHGEAFDEHGTLMHGSTVYDEQVRVPLLVLPPLGQDVVVDDLPVSLVDVTATIRAIAGAEASGSGRDLREPRDEEAIVRCEFAGVEFRPTFARSPIVAEPTQALLRGRFKLVHRPSASELFDLDEDPGERVDLAAEQPEVFEFLRAQVKPPEKFLRPARSSAAGDGLTDEERARLEKLGYLERAR